MFSIPPTYESSRDRFISGLEEIRGFWPNAIHAAYPLEEDRTLSIDWILADAIAQKRHLLVVSTGLHGIEGYVGSALLDLFQRECLKGLNPQTTGLLLVHAQNPWGMKFWQRNNPKNVDLNRNFIDGDFQAMVGLNRDYPRLMDFLNPARQIGTLWVEKMSFVWQVVCALSKVGVRRVREGALMGEYEYPKGMYFGGQRLQEETRCLMNLYRNSFKGYQRIIHLDLHTGYGPRDQMTVVLSPFEKTPASALKEKYQFARVAGANPDEFYSMHGDLNDWEYQTIQNEFPNASILAVNFEYGTFGKGFFPEARSLRITIMNNQMNQHGASVNSARWIKQEYQELYLPSDAKWLSKVFQDSKEAFKRILESEGF